ncbi:MULTISPECIES: hypothetical protein [Phytobacter]|uniref:Uncharacterized protein n=1 Tax=Phytobacter diazotrophicus TaxID=395631 RepID=A0ABM7W0D5_9ENTR|nr:MULTISPECIES: hypothetical protein [Phytobacter]BBE79619.1 hypothetical protein MRY16398_46750 [Phytobacter sp. MRY16-398]BDD52997.1 hypothetical protein PDTA9734_44840 [Phytobacter diazotrophicus]BEG83925.1 hypothetical protein PDTA9730_43810 [Phytobacter diazotrophicus]BEG89823.1 hypothetical protein PDTA9759_44790 [Phytobacter diazotrophicus]BEG95587.1 hypothetical protein PDTA9832_44460 [Phytobacter diazotrophicus]
MKLYNEQFITTENFSKYLILKGWVLFTELPQVANVWRYGKNNDYEILQPVNASLKDFSNRVNDIINALSESENKSKAEIIRELDNISNDIISLRVIHDDVANGEIPFADGILLFSKTKELMLSAARSVVNPQRGRYSGKNPEVVERFFNSLKLGQTEVGSYVLNLVAPIYWDEGSQEDYCKVPFSRTVTERLMYSIEKLNDAVGKYKERGDLKIFEAIIKDGVNATLCSAIIGLSGLNRSRVVEIKVFKSLIAENEFGENKKISITPEKIKYIEEAERFYSNDYTVKSYSLVGSVIRLNRDVNSLGGVVTIVEFSENNRKVTVELDEEHYNEAIKAHENKYENVRLIGVLIVTPKKTRLVDVSDFHIHHHSIK